MPKPAQRVPDVRPKQAVFAAGIRQFEMHPSGTGFRKLADTCWRPVLMAQFPGRGFD